MQIQGKKPIKENASKVVIEDKTALLSSVIRTSTNTIMAIGKERLYVLKYISSRRRQHGNN